MLLVLLIVVLFAGGVAAWLSERIHPDAPKKVAMLAVILDLLLLLQFFQTMDGPAVIDTAQSAWLIEYFKPWIPQFGINFFFAMDGLSLALNLLTLLLGIIAILAAWSEIKERSGFFYFNLLWTLAGVIGIFTALDLFLFFFFWEVMLIPMYFIISIWGHENRAYAAIKFFMFTQLSGLLMLLSILALVFINHSQTGTLTFNYQDLIGTETDSIVGLWIMLGFFVAFVTKLPGIPFHSWLPDAHTQAPTAGSVILAGILLKTGAYGLIRFIFPLFPEAAAEFTPIAMLLGVVSILYAAKLAFAQHDIKRLIAYTSISHMGFILLGVFAWNALALQGSVMQMLAHGISSAALFALAGGIQHRTHTRDLREMGGFWSKVPRTGAIGMFFLIAALGMPGLGNFVGETMVLFGAFQVDKVMTICAALGLIVAPVYALKVVQGVFLGEKNATTNTSEQMTDLSKHELVMMGMMIVAIIVLGIYPQPVLDLLEPSITHMTSTLPNMPIVNAGL